LIGAALEKGIQAGIERVKPENLIPSIYGAIEDFYAGIAAKIQEFADTKAEGIGKLLVDFFALMIYNAVKNMWNAPKTLLAIAEGSDGTVNFFKLVIDGVLGVAGAMLDLNLAMADLLWGIIKGAFKELGRLVTTAIDLLVDWIGSIVDIDLSSYASTWDKVKAIGKNIIDGIIKGMKDAVQGAIDAAVAAAQGIISGVQAALGIR